MNAHLYLPGDDKIDETLAEFMGYFWCCYKDGLVAGERIVRFLVSPKQFEEARAKFGPTGVVLASGSEQVEQLAFKSLPPFHASRDEMAQVEDKIYQVGLSSVYRAKLREEINGGKQVTGLLSEDEMWRMITASAGHRARAAYLVVDGQRPKQQTLFG
jgi:hypothetical protein